MNMEQIPPLQHPQRTTVYDPPEFTPRPYIHAASSTWIPTSLSDTTPPINLCIVLDHQVKVSAEKVVEPDVVDEEEDHHLHSNMEIRLLKILRPSSSTLLTGTIVTCTDSMWEMIISAKPVNVLVLPMIGMQQETIPWVVQTAMHPKRSFLVSIQIV